MSDEQAVEIALKMAALSCRLAKEIAEQGGDEEPLHRMCNDVASFTTSPLRWMPSLSSR